MKAEVRVFRMLFRAGFLKLSKYIEASLVNIISALIFIVVQYFVWQSIFANTGNEKYTFQQMFSYIVYSQMITSFFPNGIGKQLGQMIRSGDISFSLIKPVSVIKQLIYENMGISAYRLIFISFPVFLIGELMSSFQLTLNQIALFIIVMIFSYGIYACMDIIFGILQFYTSSTWGVNSLKYAVIMLLSGRILPIGLYPEWSIELLEVLPFRYMYDAPLEIIVGSSKADISGTILIEIMWFLILGLGCWIFFRKSLKYMIVQGG